MPRVRAFYAAQHMTCWTKFVDGNFRYHNENIPSSPLI